MSCIKQPHTVWRIFHSRSHNHMNLCSFKTTQKQLRRLLVPLPHLSTTGAKQSSIQINYIDKRALLLLLSKHQQRQLIPLNMQKRTIRSLALTVMEFSSLGAACSCTSRSSRPRRVLQSTSRTNSNPMSSVRKSQPSSLKALKISQIRSRRKSRHRKSSMTEPRSSSSSSTTRLGHPQTKSTLLTTPSSRSSPWSTWSSKKR